MKDATGELSMTAVAVVAIAAISVVFTTLIWPSIKQNIVRSTNCSQAFDCKCDGDALCECTYLDSNNVTQPVSCPKQDVQAESSGTTE